MRTITSPLIDGGKYRIEVPDDWDGTLILYSQGPPAPREDPVWRTTPVITALLERRYAVAGWASPMFWPHEQSFVNQPMVLDEFAKQIGSPQVTIAYGESIGGILTAGLVQVQPRVLSGALAVCGPLAGGVATHNRELDISFVFKTLVAPASALELTHISDPAANLHLALGLLEAAAMTSDGRARLALCLAISNVPAAEDPRSPAPPPHDPRTRLDAEIRWLREIVFLVTFSARATIERRAGGNPSWNTGVDYRALLERSISRDLVEDLYRQAGLDLAADLERLAKASRIQADRESVRYMERYVSFNGDLGGVPVVTMHTTGDGLCTPDHEQAYADVVRWAGQSDRLRQLWIARGGHCAFTVAEVLTALDALRARVETGSWPAVGADALNDAAAAQAEGHQALIDRATNASIPRSAQFGAFEPWAFPRPHDARMFSRP